MSRALFLNHIVFSCVFGMHRIQKILLKIKMNLQANLVKQQARLTSATEELDSAQAVLDEKQRGLDAVQALYNSAIQEKQVRFSFVAAGQNVIKRKAKCDVIWRKSCFTEPLLFYLFSISLKVYFHQYNFF